MFSFCSFALNHPKKRGADRLTADTLDYSGVDRVAHFKGRVRVRLQP